MSPPNHLAGAIVFTGFTASFWQINIFADPLNLVVICIAALLPDIDHPRSIAGRVAPPLARWINRHYGHRTITHSALILFCCAAICIAVDRFGALDLPLTKLLVPAYFSHLLLDMMTLQGVALLYPFLRNPFVIPGDTRFRIRTGDFRAEALLFSLLLMLGFSLRPMFQHGFWTQYNRFFGSTQHLIREFNRSEDLLQVAYRLHRGSEVRSGQAYCLEAQPARLVFLQRGQLVLFPLNEWEVDRVVPAHTGIRFFIRQINWYDLPLDSLNRLLDGKIIQNIYLTANKHFSVHADQPASNVQHLHQEFPGPLLLLPIHHTAPDTIPAPPDLQLNALLRKRERMLEEAAQQEKIWSLHLAYLDSLITALAAAGSLYEREACIQAIRAAEKQKPAPDFSGQLSALEDQIHLQRLQEHIQKNTQPSLEPPLLFSGTLSYFILE